MNSVAFESLDKPDQDPGVPTGALNVRQPQSGKAAGDTWLSSLVICLMAITFLALFWFPTRRMLANVEINYNEGWNAYRAAMVAGRIPLYGTPPQNSGIGAAYSYPPLSFHLIGLLGTTNTFNAVGRWVSLISLLMAGILVALIVWSAGGSRPAAFFSLLLYEIAIALMLPDRIGMNDPQLLAEALSIAGLYFYVRHPTSGRFLCASAVFFCLAGFTKQTLLAFPAAVALDLLVRSRRAFATWAGAMVLSAGVLAALTFLIDGRYFLDYLTGKRTYSYWIAWSQFHHYASLFQSLLVIATAWSICTFRSRRLFVTSFVFSCGLACLLAGGTGVDMNIFFNALAATVIACGLAFSDISFASTRIQPAIWSPAATLMFAIFCFSIMIFAPGQFRRDREKMRALPALESEFRSAVEFTKASPGPALCESLLLCYEAGKPMEIDAFSLAEELKTGQIKEDDVLGLLSTHHFQTIQIALRSDEDELKEWTDLRASLASDQKVPAKLRRFPPSFMKELLADYHLSMRTSELAVFSPN
jgi:hypothetical protein